MVNRAFAAASILAIVACVTPPRPAIAGGAQSEDPDALMKRGLGLAEAGRFAEAIAPIERALDLMAGSSPPRLSSGWYALGQIYTDLARASMSTLDDERAWRQLLTADALMQNRRLTDAFVLYRAALERLPAMVSIHDSIARIYEMTGHAAWAAQERAHSTVTAVDCAARGAMCEFRAGRHRAALAESLGRTDPESRYWRARAATELALAAFRRVAALPDSRERRGVRAALARAEERHTDAVAELQAALTFAPDDPVLLRELAAACYAARDFDRAIATLAPLMTKSANEAGLIRIMGFALLQLRRADEALPHLKRVSELDPSDAGVQLALGRAYLLSGDLAAAVPLLDAQLSGDLDGSVHVQLARAYAGLGRNDRSSALLARSQELQRAADERSAEAGTRAITPPK